MLNFAWRLREHGPHESSTARGLRDHPLTTKLRQSVSGARRLILEASRLAPWALPGLGLLVGCSSRPPTFEQVESADIAMAPADRQALAGLLSANGLEARDLAILQEGAGDAPGSSARLEGDRVVALRLEGIREASGLDTLEALRELTLEGDFERLSLTGPSPLERLDVLSPQETLRELELSNLQALQTVTISGGELEGRLQLEELPALEALALNRAGLQSVPTVEGSRLRDLNLAGNRIQDLAQLVAHPELETLRLDGNGLVSLESLPAFSELKALYLGHNPLSPDVRLARGDFPSLRTLDLRFTDLEHVPEGLEGFPLRWEETRERREDFQDTLDRLRETYVAHERVAALPSSGGVRVGTRGKCQWRTGSFHRAEVRCDLEIDSLTGLAFVHLGTTDPAFPFQGGGAPYLSGELSVGEGTAALYLRETYDLVALARQLTDAEESTAEAARQPEDHFDGYRRLIAEPGSPARFEGEPSLLGSRVVLYVEAVTGSVKSLRLEVKPR